ncbi:isoamyl acetate-hydrolyzing esterase [Coemansia sp. RSA 2131]|nr:isoamyl acetate-hydrolyzing esterase [Coemansia sp. RSA 2131]
MLFIFLGANDARLPSKEDSSTLEEYQSNLHAIISLLRDPASEHYSLKTRILIITPPPIGELMIQSYTPTFAADPFVFNNRTRLFAEMAKQVAREANVPSIDLYSEIENRVREEQATGKWSSRYDGYDNYLVDGVHLNNKGANDARLPSKTDSSTLEQYQSNLHAIISLLRDPASEHYSLKTRILIITPPPIGELMIQSYTPTFAADPFVFNNRTRLFAEMAKQVAREANVPSIDLYSEIENRVREEQATGTWFSRYDGYDNYLVDGVHLNNKGNMLLYNLILTTFKAVWPEMLPKSLPS